MYKAINIKWDTDGCEIDLPDEVKIPERFIDKDGVDEEAVSDWLSDGWLHDGFEIVDEVKMENNMDIKNVMEKSVRALLSSGSYDDLNEEQNAVVVEFETELWKPKVDELRKTMSPKEIEERIHDWWEDYEIADGTEENLLDYI